MDKRPNLLFIFTDQQRWDTIRALGNPAIRTPNLDRLAAAGTAFRNAFTPSPECVPARASLAFGQHPAQTGCYGNGDAFPFDAKETYMAALTRAGYRTRGIGKCHFEHPDEAKALGGNGFETRERQEEIVRDPANDEYLSHLQANGGDHIVDPHGIRGDMY